MFSNELIVRGYHCDAYGHVNNARYLEFFEECRWSFLQPIVQDQTFDKLGLLFVVYKINVHYKRPLVPNDKVDVQIREVTYSSRSIEFKQEIRKGEIVYTQADVQFVLLEAQSKKATPITEIIKSMFNELMQSDA